MTSSQTATIDSMAKASRYLSSLGGRLGFDEALRRVEERSDGDVRERLRGLERWVKGETSDEPSPELALVGNVARVAARQGDGAKAIDAAGEALDDARMLSDQIRSGIADGIGYAGLLLVIAALIAVIWLTSIAPAFESMYLQVAASLPALTQVFIDAPWLIFIAIGALGLALTWLVISTARLAGCIETMAPLGASWITRLVGSRAGSLHRQWRAAALARAWAAGGQAPLDAITEAARVAGLSPKESAGLAAEIRLASELGGARSELEYQARHMVTAYRDALEFRRALIMRSIQVAIGLLVGVIVLAIYLPLFRMGAVV